MAKTATDFKGGKDGKPTPPKAGKGFPAWVESHKPVVIGLVVLLLGVLYFMSRARSAATTDPSAASAQGSTSDGTSAYTIPASDGTTYAGGDGYTDDDIQAIYSELGSLGSGLTSAANTDSRQGQRITRENRKISGLGKQIKGLGNTITKLQKDISKLEHPSSTKHKATSKSTTTNHAGNTARAAVVTHHTTTKTNPRKVTLSA